MARRHLILWAVPVVVALAACGGREYPSERRDAPVVRVAGRVPILGIAPRRGWSYYHAQVNQYVFEGLTRIGEDLSLLPSLAHDWTSTPDGREYRFHLRSGVAFHDGTPFTAADVARAWEAALREPVDSVTHPWMLQQIDGIDAFLNGIDARLSGLSIVDDTTLDVRLSEPLAFFPTLLSLSQASIPGMHSREDRPVGTGPWIFHSSDSSEVVFAANPAHWDGRPTLDSLMYRHVPYARTVPAFESGWVDVLSDLTAETRAEWSARPDVGFVESDAVTVTRLVINLREPTLQDARVRRGLNHAIDATRIAEATASVSTGAAAGTIPPSFPGADPTREPYEFRPGLARRLLEEGGYPLDRPLRVWVPNPGLSDIPPQIGTLLRDYFEAVGLRVEVTVRTQGIDEALVSGAADLALSIWVADYPDGDAFLYPLYHSAAIGSGGNDGAYANPALDALIEASRREPDPERRAALLRDADRIVFDDAPAVFLWFTRTATVYSMRLAGWGRDPLLSRLTRLRLAGPARD